MQLLYRTQTGIIAFINKYSKLSQIAACHTIFASHSATRCLTMDNRQKTLIAVAQMTCTSDRNANWNQLEMLVSKASNDGAQVVFLPEGCDYIASSRKESIAFAEELTGPFVQKLKDLAKKRKVWISAGGVHIKSEISKDGRLSNTHLLINCDGEICGSYTKAHLFSNTVPGISINEADYVRPGDELVAPIPSPAGNIALALCYDLRFPDLSQALRRLGAHILTFPSAFTVATGEAHWHILLRARAIECQSYVVAAAQTGQHNEKRSSYGHALVVDPWGRVLCEVAEDVGCAVAEVDLSSLIKIRNQMPCNQHRRQDLMTVSIASCHSQSRLLQLEQVPESIISHQFGTVTVPGDAIFLYSALSFAFTNLYPRSTGHIMVSPRACVPRFKLLSAGELSDLAQMTVLSARLLCSVHNVDQCEVAVQDGPHSGQTIQHVHIHVLPHISNISDSLLSPDVPSASQSEEAQRQSRVEKELAMIRAATEIRSAYQRNVHDIIEEGSFKDPSFHLPQTLQLLPIKNINDESLGTDNATSMQVVHTNVPINVICMRTAHTIIYCMAGDWQKCHLVVQLVREVDYFQNALPNEASDMFAVAHHLQTLLDKLFPDISTTFVIRGKSQHFPTVQLHVLPWLKVREPSDQVYSYVSDCKPQFGDTERELATLLEAAFYNQADTEGLRSFLK
uniref:Nitrilase and fragile histidine triad fusion protein NitFhit-like isoform X2 n=2 Tax=Hirondellea gigas TaxID=1518452 RepID=A0A6A7FV78_9CRUS